MHAGDYAVANTIPEAADTKAAGPARPFVLVIYRRAGGTREVPIGDTDVADETQP